MQQQDGSPPIESDSEILRAVHRIATGLFSRPGLDEMLPEVLSAALDSVRALAGTIYLHDPKDDTLVFRHVVGGDSSLVGSRMPSSQGIAGVVFHSGTSVVTGDASRDSRHVDIAAHYPTRSMVTVPLRNLGGRSVGVMQVLNKANSGVFSEEHDRVVLETLASLAATAIENAQQAERERKAAVAEAVGDISHDIKNMMTPVEGWASTIASLLPDSIAVLDRLEAAGLQALDFDLKELRYLFDLVPEALEGIREGAQEAKDRGAEIADALVGNVRAPQFITQDCIRTINRVCKTLQNSAESRGISLNLEGSCPPFPHDRTHLFNAVYNLVNNAIPYVASGGAIRVVMSQVDDCAEIAVIDTGQGMPEAVRQSLFKEGAISTTAGGSGLGTGIVARVARAHGGTVTVESTLGEGSTFRLRLPLKRPDESLAA